MPRQPKARRQVEEAAAEADGPCAAGAVVHGAGVAVQCFLDCDLTDKAASFIARQSEGMRLQLRQSHGWIDGWLDAGSLEDARARYSPANKHSWPRVTPDRKYSFVDRHGRSLPDPDPAVPGPDPDPDPDAAPAPAPAPAPAHAHAPDPNPDPAPSPDPDPDPDRHGRSLPTPQLCVRIEDLREAGAAAQPHLSVLFVRWGGAHRLGEGCEPADEGDGGWGEHGSPPSDWYIDAVVRRGLLAHPTLGGRERNCEVATLFLGSDAELRALVPEAPKVARLLRGRKACSWWMLWPADFPADWASNDYVAYVPRIPMFEGQRALEATHLVKSAFPHPADLWEWITGKTWMATLAPQAASMRHRA